MKLLGFRICDVDEAANTFVLKGFDGFCFGQEEGSKDMLDNFVRGRAGTG